MSEHHKMIVRRWFEEVWNQGREATVDELLAQPASRMASEILKRMSADPPSSSRLRQTFAASCRISVSTWTIWLPKATAWPFGSPLRELTPARDLASHRPGTGSKFQGVIILKIHNGQLVEGWNSYDQLGLLRQIGALPGLGQPDRFLAAS